MVHLDSQEIGEPLPLPTDQKQDSDLFPQVTCAAVHDSAHSCLEVEHQVILSRMYTTLLCQLIAETSGLFEIY